SATTDERHRAAHRGSAVPRSPHRPAGAPGTPGARVDPVLCAGIPPLRAGAGAVRGRLHADRPSGEGSATPHPAPAHRRGLPRPERDAPARPRLDPAAGARRAGDVTRTGSGTPAASATLVGIAPTALLT